LLSLTGGIIGSLLSLWGVNLLWTMVPEEVRYFGQAMINLRVLGFVLVTSVVTAFIFGIIPALQLARPQLTETLKEGRAGGTSLNRRRWRSFLIVTEVGLALTLLTGAGLLIRSFNRLTNTNLGFDPQNVLTMKISLPSTRYPEVSEQMVFWNQLLGNIEHLAGVHHAGAIEQLPISGGRLRTKVLVEGYPEPANPAEIPQVEWYTVTPNYFPAMAIPLLRGRLFDTSDGKDSPYVVIISEAMANKYWPGQDPVGKRIRLQKFARKANMDWGSWVSIVGVVSDAKRKAEDAPAPTIYTNLPQNPSPEMTLAIRTVSDPVSIAAAASQEVWRLDQNLVVTQVRPMTEIVSASATQPRFRTSLLTILAIVSLLLAAIGVYGTISYSVSQRTHEMGIRLALGAQQFDIFKLIIGESLKLASLGVIIGAIASYLLSRVLSKFLFGVSATDPVTYLTVSLLIILAVFVASFIPARRAAKLNSMAALLHE
jgi:putative ABC transport system permease protein